MSQFAAYPSLRDIPVFITGGGSGIGAAMVEGFVLQGSRVAFVDVDRTASLALCSRLEKAGPHAAHFIPCDVRDIDALRNAIDSAQKAVGDIGVLVNNAARDDRHAIEEVTVEYWDERVAVNLRHQFFAAQAVVEHMKRRGGGSIINFGSVSWMLKAGGMPAYTTSKAAVHGMSRSLATDLGPFRIRVNTISPGWVMTERQLKLWVTPDGERRLDENQCLPGRVQPQDIALMALFLGAEDSRMITAQNFIVDAGWV